MGWSGLRLRRWRRSTLVRILRAASDSVAGDRVLIGDVIRQQLLFRSNAPRTVIPPFQRVEVGDNFPGAKPILDHHRLPEFVYQNDLGGGAQGREVTVRAGVPAVEIMLESGVHDRSAVPIGTAG